MNSFKFACCYLALLVLALGAQASTKYEFLTRSVFGSFSQADADSLRSAARSLLDEDGDQIVREWRSESGLRGKMKIAFSYESDGLNCRQIRLLFLNQAKRRENYQFDLCKESGVWEVRDTPVRYFSAAETELMEQNIGYALQEAEAGFPVTWNSPKTGSGGTVVTQEKFQWQSKQCRAAAISIYDRKGRQASGRYVFCLNAESQWRREAAAE